MIAGLRGHWKTVLAQLDQMVLAAFELLQVENGMTAYIQWRARNALALGVFGLLSFSCVAADAAVGIEGQVQIGGGAVVGSTVSLWAASADAPARLAQATTTRRAALSSQSMRRRATLRASILSPAAAAAVAKVGGDNKGIDLLAVLGTDPPSKVVVNELTTVASAFTDARFLHGRVDLRQSARPEDRRRERAEPRRSHQRRMGQDVSRSH